MSILRRTMLAGLTTGSEGVVGASLRRRPETSHLGAPSEGAPQQNQSLGTLVSVASQLFTVTFKVALHLAQTIAAKFFAHGSRQD